MPRWAAQQPQDFSSATHIAGGRYAPHRGRSGAPARPLPDLVAHPTIGTCRGWLLTRSSQARTAG